MTTKLDYTKIAHIRNVRFSIYKITNLVNGKIYVGKAECTLAMRMNKHCHHVLKGTNRYLYDAIRHYGWDAFSIEIIETCPDDKEKLNEREKYWIAELKTLNKEFGYNMTEGGTGGGNGDILRAFAAARKGKPLPQETKDKISAANKGRSPHPMTDEIKSKLSKTLTGRMPSRPIHEIIKERGLPPNRLGKKHTEETKKLLSLHHDHLCHKTDEQLKVMSENWKGAGNPLWVEVSKEELVSLIKENLSPGEIASKLNISRTTVYSKIETMLGVKGLVAARKLVKDEKFSIY